MMLREQELAPPIELGIERPELITQQLLLEQLLLQPERHRHTKGAKARGRKREIGLQQTLELEEWLVVERDIVDFTQSDAALAQAILERVMWEVCIVFLSCEAFFLGGSGDLPVDDECRRAVMVERG